MYPMTMRAALLACGAATAVATIPAAHAQTAGQSAREAALEARLARLEARVAALTEQLAAARAEQAPAPRAPSVPAASAPTALPVAVASARPAPAAPPATTSGTRVTLSGFIKFNASVSRYADGAIAANSGGRDFYVPGTIPVGGTSEGASTEFSAKQTRLVAGLTTPVDGETLSGLVEIDFQSSPGAGNARITNAYAPALRRTWLSYRGFLAGQEWTNFQYLPALPETTDFLGPSEGTVFVRQAQLRYTHKLADRMSLSVAAENPATTVAIAGSAAVVEAGTDRAPDLTARFTADIGGGSQLSLAGVSRWLTSDQSGMHDDGFGWGVSAAGKLRFGPAGRHDLRFMVTHGRGIGRYVGLNLAPDAILVPGAQPRLETVGVTAGFAALRIGWTPSLRSNLGASYQTIDYPSGFATPNANASAWSAMANLFYTPLDHLDLGIELRRGERELVSGAAGTLERLEVSARYGF
ncbi:DcaP family trimeric outer membrane transporter [Stakelama tenebrarum]|uniref:Porin n=1 Tax=Stakelama tenebrarum TaxID=2711215 RepID=A0A6G6Y7X4_9SPHN|nr:DcaP family trimeric outer membrane transporter [Sphingosinithalassobacter tenebrarum]QIG81042.1 hypothetical protein G5C33_15460 [Sphingosinithalassobacter tenebrarum]